MEDEYIDFKFDWIENSVVVAMLFLSFLIGVYYTFFKNQNTFDEYMMGGRTMSVFPVAMSLVASSFSGTSLLGMPVEIYLYGTQTASVNFALIISALITAIFYLPVYHKLRLNSVFEYLELRFNKHVRIIGILLFTLFMVLLLPTVIYAPSVCLYQGIPVQIIAYGISAICIFYTSFGGLKAVMWTDALQNCFTFFGVVFFIAVSCRKLGGVGEIWRINEKGGRLEMFNLNPDPFQRNTLWTTFIFYLFIYVSNFAAVPSSIQRYMSVPTLRDAKWVLVYTIISLYVMVNLTMFLGLILYARYHQCDPMAAGMIKTSTQMVPLFVSEVGKDYPGLAGLIVSGILSASLSTMSSWLNAVGGMLYKDVMEVYFPYVQYSDTTEYKVIRVVVIVLGVVSVMLVMVVEKLGTLLQIAMTAAGTIMGSSLSLFTLGIFFPRVNAKGAVTGALASFILSVWISLNSQYYIMSGALRFPGKATSIDQCPSVILEHFNSSTSLLFNYTGIGSPVEADSYVSQVYQLSYNYYVVVGTIFGILVGLIVSLLTERPDISSMSPDLFSPCVHRFLHKKTQAVQNNKEVYELVANHNNTKLQVDQPALQINHIVDY